MFLNNFPNLICFANDVLNLGFLRGEALLLFCAKRFSKTKLGFGDLKGRTLLQPCAKKYFKFAAVCKLCF